MGKRKVPEISDDHPMYSGGPSFDDIYEDSRISEEQEDWLKHKEVKRKAKDKEGLTQSLGDLLRTKG